MSFFHKSYKNFVFLKEIPIFTALIEKGRGNRPNEALATCHLTRCYILPNQIGNDKLDTKYPVPSSLKAIKKFSKIDSRIFDRFLFQIQNSSNFLLR